MHKRSVKKCTAFPTHWGILGKNERMPTALSEDGRTDGQQKNSDYCLCATPPSGDVTNGTKEKGRNGRAEMDVGEPDHIGTSLQHLPEADGGSNTTVHTVLP